MLVFPKISKKQHGIRYIAPYLKEMPQLRLPSKWQNIYKYLKQIRLVPYLIFPTKHYDNLAWNIVNNLVGENGKVTGLVARINTDKHGLVSFFSEEPYMAAINEAGISYTIISKDEISNLLIDVLREANPQYADEL